MNGWLFLAVTSTVALIVLIFSIPYFAMAHDPAHPELNAWFDGLTNGSGGPCCDGTDAKRVDDADWESEDGHYRVRIDGEWVDVPDGSVIRGPNKAGRTMVWPYYLDGHPRARCFAPGPMG